ncbi:MULTISPECIES: pyoverdine biosynthesis protein [Pseudomonas]|uniref:Pyoverdine biosynthesis protein n=1 Tax=Pseudomonas sessilinigenes TaxID=658629 RepID=A0ABX8MGP0_9PSED|nr:MULTISPECIES: pyoverdine biosynthesis protein [Pseudomonas]AZC27741.1 PvdY [Pseudomonas sessilinigenes]QIH09875.1 pyoverdine biosynthesis protein [Pseudomonas sp. BIOMIG1BAC]QXH38374.1 hypothetical protein KSS89_19085 [Pseudomonas sessilinigenes]UMZ10138.1 hypothetical protein I9018_21915 [Pseudomonas sp. MPFS]
MALVNPLNIDALRASMVVGIDGIAARQALFQPGANSVQEPSIQIQAAEAARQERLAFWLSAQVHALYLDPPGCEGPPAFVHESACAGPDRCRYCQREFDLLHKRAALRVLGQSGLLEG